MAEPSLHCVPVEIWTKAIDARLTSELQPFYHGYSEKDGPCYNDPRVLKEIFRLTTTPLRLVCKSWSSHIDASVRLIVPLGPYSDPGCGCYRLQGRLGDYVQTCWTFSHYQLMTEGPLSKITSVSIFALPTHAMSFQHYFPFHRHLATLPNLQHLIIETARNLYRMPDGGPAAEVLPGFFPFSSKLLTLSFHTDIYGATAMTSIRMPSVKALDVFIQTRPTDLILYASFADVVISKCGVELTKLVLRGSTHYKLESLSEVAPNLLELTIDPTYCDPSLLTAGIPPKLQRIKTLGVISWLLWGCAYTQFLLNLDKSGDEFPIKAFILHDTWANVMEIGRSFDWGALSWWETVAETARLFAGTTIRLEDSEGRLLEDFKHLIPLPDDEGSDI